MSENFSYEDALIQPEASGAFSYEDATGEKPKDPGILRGIGDSAIALGAGVTQGIGMLANVAGADNAVSRTMGDAT